MSTLIASAALIAAASGGFQAVLDDARIAQSVPGVSVVVSRDDQTLFAGASGVADLESGRPITADTPLYAGSLSKVFTAALVLNLVEQGSLSLAQSAPGISTTPATAQDTPAAPISVAHLLTHASGLVREGDFGYWFSGRFPDRVALDKYLGRTRLRSPPGEGLHYSNVGYAALGRMIETATALDYGAALRQNILQPLGMHSSGAPGPAKNVAIGYTPENRIIPSAERPFAGVGRAVGNRHVREYHDAAAMSPAFGVYTSANDLGRLARFLLGSDRPDVLSTHMRQRMRTRQASGWGLGLKIGTLRGRTVARHDGWFAAHRSHLLLDVDTGLSVVVLANSDGASPAKIAEALHREALALESPGNSPGRSLR